MKTKSIFAKYFALESAASSTDLKTGKLFKNFMLPAVQKEHDHLLHVPKRHTLRRSKQKQKKAA